MSYSLHGSTAKDLAIQSDTDVNITDALGGDVGPDPSEHMLVLNDMGNQHALIVEGDDADLRDFARRVTEGVETLLAKRHGYTDAVDPDVPAAGDDDALRVTVTRSAGKDGAVLVFLDTEGDWEPEPTPGFTGEDRPGLRVLINDHDTYAGVEFDPRDDDTTAQYTHRELAVRLRDLRFTGLAD